LNALEATMSSTGRAPPRPLTERRERHPRELEDWLNFHVYHPLGDRLAGALVATPVTPNMVSFGGWALIVAAAFLYTGLAWPVSVLLALPLHLLWHVLDGADGDLARRTGKASALGELVDGVCDYTGHIILYVVLAAFLSRQTPAIGGWAWWIAAAAGASRILQSNHAESQRRIYLWRVYGIPWLKDAYGQDGGLDSNGLFTRLFEPFARLYLAGASASNPLSARVDALVVRSEGKPRERERMSRICRRAARKAIRVQTHLGANLRTVALGISMMAGSPLWFFLYEIVPLTLVLLWSRRLQRRCDLTILARPGS
jgi:hypothetical protein